MISIELQGRLGNQLFQYAVCRSVAERNGYDYHIDRDKWICNEIIDADLGIEQGFAKDKEFIKVIRGHVCRIVKEDQQSSHKIRYIFEETDIKYKPFNANVFRIKDNTLLKGYFPSPKYSNYEDVIRWFKVRKAVIVPEDVCYVNFRGGDFNNTYYQVGKTYYSVAINMMKSFGIKKFIVITDDIEEARKWFLNYEVYHTDEDFFIINNAKYLVIGNSTFSFWAAYLNKYNIVIAPSGWKNYNNNKNIFNPTDIKVDRFIYV